MDNVTAIARQRAEIEAMKIPSNILGDIGVKTAAVFNGSGILVQVPQDWSQQIIPQLDLECRQINVTGMPIPEVRDILEVNLKTAQAAYKLAVRNTAKKSERYIAAGVSAGIAISLGGYSAGKISTLNNLPSCENVPPQSVYAQICDVPTIKSMYENTHQDALGSAGVALTFALIAAGAFVAGRKVSKMALNDFKNAAAAKGNAEICLLKCEEAESGNVPLSSPQPS